MEVRVDTMCRACMCEQQTMLPLFPHSQDTPNLSHMIMTIAQIRVLENDGLPYHLCYDCATKLDAAINFKNLCEKSDNLFRQHLSDKTLIKEEMGADISYEGTINSDVYDDFLMFKAEPEIQLNEEKPNIAVEIRSDGSTSVSHSCRICGRAYSNMKTLKKHLSTHGEDDYKCTHCPKTFSKYDHIVKHLRQSHSIFDIDGLINKDKHFCECCNTDFRSASALVKHVKTFHKDKQMKDAMDFDDSDDDDDDNSEKLQFESAGNSQSIDLVTTTSAGGAVATIKEEISQSESRLVLEVMYRCNICGIDYDNQQSYAAHMTKHSAHLPKDTSDFKCDLCDKTFAKRKNLKQHALTHNKEKPNKCTLCHRAFTRPDQLILHMNNHTGKKRHQCVHCNKGFNMLSTLKDHLRVHSGEKPYLCSICGKGFTQNTNLKQHLMRHSSTKPFGCTTCHAKFVSKGELDAHLRKHTGDHPFVCDMCGTGFTTSSSLVKHKRIHTGEKPYPCDLCPLRFTALGTLKNHRRTHTGEKPFACSHCPRRFAQKSDLASHNRTHTGERPYVCATCGAPFLQSSALKAHIRNVHPLVNKLYLASDSNASMAPVLSVKISQESTDSSSFVCVETGE